MIAVNFIDLRELAYADYKNIAFSLSLYPAAEIVEESVLVPEARKSIDMSLRAVIAYRSDEIVRHTRIISDNNAFAGADIEYSVRPSYTVLHIVS